MTTGHKTLVTRIILAASIGLLCLAAGCSVPRGASWVGVSPCREQRNARRVVPCDPAYGYRTTCWHTWQNGRMDQRAENLPLENGAGTLEGVPDWLRPLLSTPAGEVISGAAGRTEQRIGENPGPDNPGADNPGANQPAADDTDQTAADQPDTDEPRAGDADEPDADEPDADEPDADEPDADEPDADEPDADEPRAGDADEPDADEPDADEPDADEPDAGDADQPDAGNPDADQLDTDQLGAAEPAPATPTNPTPATPTPTKSSPTNPPSTNPASTNPAVITPEPTNPTLATPASTNPEPTNPVFPTTSELPTWDNSAVLTIWVPYQAKVTINGLLTESTGTRRQYVSIGLQPGFGCEYQVHAEIVRDGKVVAENRTVTLTAGQQGRARFRFQGEGRRGRRVGRPAIPWGTMPDFARAVSEDWGTVPFGAAA